MLRSSARGIDSPRWVRADPSGHDSARVGGASRSARGLPRTGAGRSSTRSTGRRARLRGDARSCRRPCGSGSRASCRSALPEIARRDGSADGSVKFGLRLSDGALIEAVYMPGRGAVARVNEFADARAPSPSRRCRNPESAHSTPPSREIHRLPLLADRLRGRLRVLRDRPARRRRNLTAGEILGQLYAVLADDRPHARGAARRLHGHGGAVPEPRGRPAGARDPLRDPPAAAGHGLDLRHHAGASRASPRCRAGRTSPSRSNAADEATRTRLMPITRTYPLAGPRRGDARAGPSSRGGGSSSSTS